VPDGAMAAHNYHTVHKGTDKSRYTEILKNK